MRLTCPNCGAAYLVADHLIPTAGRHVQCTACHTRWFARGAPAATVATPAPVLAAVAGAAPVAQGADQDTAAAPAPIDAGTAPEGAPEPETAPRMAVAPDTAPVTDEPAADETAPASEPATVLNPLRPLPGATGSGEPAAGTGPRRLALAPQTQPADTPRGRRRFVAGFLVALVLAAVALAAYVFEAEIVARVPAAAAALAAYTDAVDAARLWLDETVGRHLARLLG
jgi:predicted Zn finger-like uncharacterized protein